MDASRRRGRPGQPIEQRKRNTLAFRVRDQMKAKLEVAADKSERSVSEEIEYRLMMSFDDEALVQALLEATIDTLRRRRLGSRL